MPHSFTCPFCNHTIPLISATYYNSDVQFRSRCPLGGFNWDNTYSLNVRMYKCPNCEKITSFADYTGSEMPSKTIPIFPISTAKQFPHYIPESIRSDYEEACSIVNLSPKASATLSRRCLQAMIRDFWQITNKRRLVDEIDALKEKVPATQWQVIDSLRHIGNIGAHPEADVNLIIDINPEDAQKLISVIELLLRQWYVERHEQEQLYTDVLSLNMATKSQRNKG